ncbi:MAG: hypothetical protein ABJL99_27430 [Aliishimia sp.]
MRKVRIPRDEGGKSDCFHMMYVFGGHHIPIFLITVFVKNEKTNLSAREQAEVAAMSKEILSMWSDKQ